MTTPQGNEQVLVHYDKANDQFWSLEGHYTLIPRAGDRFVPQKGRQPDEIEKKALFVYGLTMNTENYLLESVK